MKNTNNKDDEDYFINDKWGDALESITLIAMVLVMAGIMLIALI